MGAPRPVSTLDEALARMREIDAGLPVEDGVAWFNKLYLRATEEVQEELGNGGFENPVFLDRLAVVLVDSYLRAYDGGEADAALVPKAWAPLFDARGRPAIAPIQFALAGLNAHVNHDLPIGVVDVCGELGLEVERGTSHHADLQRINALVAEVEEDVKRWFATGFVGVLDHAFGRVDDVIAIWSVEQARDHAWVVAETLSALGGLSFLREQYVRALGRMTGFAGRGLLLPIGELLD